MKVNKKDLGKSEVELTVELSVEEFAPFVKKGAEKISQEVKIDGFRKGKAPFEMIKQKVGEMAINEEAARIAINKTIDKVFEENLKRTPIGQPRVDITKIAPENPMEYKVIVALLPEVELKKYKDLKIKQKEVKIKTEGKGNELDKTLADLQDMRVKEAIVDREVQATDKVLVDIEMFLDKVPVEGGQSKGVAIMMGKDYVVPGFDKQLLKAKKGDDKNFSLPFPKEYHMKNLAGKMVDFKVKVTEVYGRELPEINEEFAKAFGMKSVDELKEHITKNLTQEKTKEVEQIAEKEMLEKMIEKNGFGDIPDMLVDHELKTMMAELKQSIESQGGKFEDYLNSIKKTSEELTLELAPEAMKRVKVSLMIKAIGEKEKLEVTEKEVEEHIEEMKKRYASNKDAADKVTTPEYKRYIYNVLSSRKVVNTLRDWNIVTK